MTGQYSASRPAGREHVPTMPKGFIAIRIVQLVLAVIVLALSAFTLSMFPFRSNGLSTFTSIATIGITIYSIVVEFSRDAWKSYNYWAILSLDIFLVVFWLVSFAIMAADVAPFGDGGGVCDGWGDCLYLGDALFACLAAIAGLGGAEFALFIVSLAMHSVAVHRHRAAGLHCKAGGSPAQAHAAGGFGDIPNQHNAIPMGGPVPQEKQHPAPTYSAVAPDQHQHHQQQPYQQPQPQQPQPQQPQQPQQQYVGVSPSPPSAGMYQPPTSSLASPQPFYPPQGQQVSPVGGQFGGGPVPAPHPGSYEAQGQPVGYQQH